MEPESWKKRAPEPESHSWKPRAPELEPCSWKELLRSRSSVLSTTAPQSWNNPHCSRVHRRSRVKIQQISCFSSNLQRFVSWYIKICKKQTSHNSRLLKLTQWLTNRCAFSPPFVFSPPCSSKSSPNGRFRPLWETLF